MHVNRYHVINDPIHGAMQFTKNEISWIKPFIDHPSFQRLRHIKQLGMGDLIFPGAVHTRFNHSLGACYVANQMATKIGLPESDKQLAIVAALLHDIGHGPFSHAFEELFTKNKIHHEDWTPSFIQEFHDEKFLYEYNKNNPAFPWCPEKFLINQKLIMHEQNDKKLLSDIISSQLDADRLDYLPRDSHFCGVSYGKFDYRWLLHCLTVVEIDGMPRLGITYKGIGVVENYLIARRLMIRNIYYHHKKYAAEHLVKELLNKVATQTATKPEYRVFKNSPLVKFLEKTAVFNEQTSYPENAEKAKQTFIETNYPLYKQLCDYDIYALIRELSSFDGQDDAVLIAKRLINRKLPAVITIDDHQFEKIATMVQALLSDKSQGISAWQIAALHPRHHSYLSRDQIKIEDELGRVRNIDENSLIINALLDKNEATSFLCVDKELLTKASVKHLLNEVSKSAEDK